MNSSLKIGYLSAEDPKNKKVWSGTHYSIYKALSTIGRVEILGPVEPTFALTVGKTINQLLLRLFKKRFDYRHSPLLSKAYAAFFSKKISEGSYDLLVAPAASTEIAFLETNVPILYITDGTFKSCLNYHKSLTHLTANSITLGNLIEQKGIQKSKKIIVSSEWAAKSLKEDYGASPDKIHVLPFGANFEVLPSEQELVFEIPVKWKLLFVGVYWDSKGGDIAFNAFNLLRERGYAVSLTVVGCIPPEEVKDENITVIPFIDKNDAEGQKKLSAIFASHHLLLLPTRFDCTPIVINEASAFGIPSIVANTGGVKGHLTEGLNGFLVDYSDKGNKYAEIIEGLITEPLKYISLRQSTRKLYIEKLNWHTWTKEFKKIIENF
ncbi:MAG: glycosyltransferase family 4 protein [Bacteroidetes bacterium]|nr:glycosyltransferase family 4 protein [Bacteroidota bacterium]